MNDLVDKLVGIVQDAGGAVTWEDLINAVDYSERAQVPKALKLAKAQQKLKRHLMFENGAKVHRVLAWSHPDNPQNQVGE